MDLSREIKPETLSVSEAWVSPAETAGELESELGLQPGFLNRVKDEDDWSFIIKTHAFIEAALSYLLLHALNRPELERPVSKLNYTVKMQFIEALNLLEDRDRRFLYAINELRNTVIHDVRNTSFDLSAYVGGFDENRLQNEAKRFDSFSEDEKAIDIPSEGRQPVLKVFKEFPKRSIWWSAMNTVGIIYQSKKVVALRQQSEAAKSKAWEAIASPSLSVNVEALRRR